MIDDEIGAINGKIAGGTMSCPGIKIQLTATACNCCSSSAIKEEYRILYNSKEDVFEAIPPDESLFSPTTIAATISALNRALQQSYSVSLDEVPIHINVNELPTFHQVKQIEFVAKNKFVA